MGEIDYVFYFRLNEQIHTIWKSFDLDKYDLSILGSEKIFHVNASVDDKMHRVQNNRQKLIHRAKMKSLRISVAIVAAFIICWTPYYAVMIICMFMNPDKGVRFNWWKFSCANGKWIGKVNNFPFCSNYWHEKIFSFSNILRMQKYGMIVLLISGVYECAVPKANNIEIEFQVVFCILISFVQLFVCFFFHS